MNDKQLAAETIEREVNRLRGLMLAGEQLKKLGNLEQTENELLSSIDAQERKLSSLKEKEDVAISSMALETQKANALRVETDAEEKRLAELATHEMATARKAATEEGDKIIAQANQKHREVMAQVSKLESRLVEVNKEIAVREYKLEGLMKEFAELTKKHLG